MFFICLSVRPLISFLIQKRKVLAVSQYYKEFCYFYLHEHSPKTGKDYSELLQSIFILCQDAVSIYDISKAIFKQKKSKGGKKGELFL